MIPSFIFQRVHRNREGAWSAFLRVPVFSIHGESGNEKNRKVSSAFLRSGLLPRFLAELAEPLRIASADSISSGSPEFSGLIEVPFEPCCHRGPFDKILCVV
jgi:hypothetical protein